VADLTDLVRLLTAEHGLAVVSLARGEGSVVASVVNAGLLAHPVSAVGVIGFVTRGDAAKLRRLRRRPLATVTARSGWEWVTAEGPVDLAGPDDPLGAVEVRTLLRQVFRAAGGTHEDWDEFDRVMGAEGRAAVLVRPERVYGVVRPG